ncbi:hypothetical protein [Bacillus sp. FJAT-47783]|uniref:hypothetical protein n=1 Tax=Bacillus sp. FJAT-47783 TaxID=2922712 RepID=UPI001FAD65B8|nr:hypothetical protein [Bacillus sp. FJAT-47783]
MRVVTVSLLTVLLLTSCQHTNQHTMQEQYDGRHILFFSDVRTINEEAVYYDALLQLKKDYPKEIENMVVFQAAQTSDEPFDIDTYPSLLVVENNQIIVHIQGRVEQKETIVEAVQNVLSQ